MPAGFQALALGVYAFWLLLSFGVFPITIVWVLKETAETDPLFITWIGSAKHKLILAAVLAPFFLFIGASGVYAIFQLRRVLHGKWPFPCRTRKAYGRRISRR